MSLELPRPKRNRLSHLGHLLSEQFHRVLPNNQAQDLAISEYSIPIQFLPEGLRELKIIQLSDIHVYEYSDLTYHQRVIETVNALQPDIIAITGDVIHYGSVYVSTLQDLLKELRPKIGIYACLGNHDYWDDARSQNLQAMYQQLDVTLLTNQAVPLEINSATLWMSGIDDIMCGIPKPELAFADIPDNAIHICLAHNPWLANPIARQSKAPDIILSGHTHGGQIRLKSLHKVSKRLLKQHYEYGWYNLGETQLYVTSGVGSALVAVHTQKFDFALKPYRYQSQPEIAVFTLQ